ncbi:arginase [Ruegeria sediminis]|uniref:Arginase n=2 Tax=Ruegeria sediminis TaxID=2583820 RepID=A0ABY2WVD9_9RHOB|nr:arginase [Ruegeria sediminis]
MFGGGGEAGNLLGLPTGDFDEIAADIVVFGADCATPYGSVGAYCAGGPFAIRTGAAAYAGDTGKVNFDLGGPVLPAGVRAVDAGDLSVDAVDAPGNRAKVENATKAVLQAGAVPILLGGDDSVPIPFLQAYEAHGPLTVLQIDAHIDWRDEVQGERMGLSSTMRRASEMRHVERIVQVGARGVGSAGMDALEAATAWGAHLIPAHELSAGGMERALDLIPARAQVVICFDCDALDPAIMPAVIAATAGGLSYGQALHLIKGVAAKARIAGFDLVEFMPERDRDQAGARTAAQLVTSVLGLVGRQVAEMR